MGVFDFERQKKIGQKGEEFFLANWPEPVRRRTEEFKGADFLDLKGRILEVKTDTYDLRQTLNFFWERWSNWATKKPGGPWQSLEKGAQILVYLFLTNRTWFEFHDLPALVARLEELTHNSREIYVRNEGWTTVGYKVRRSDLADLYVERKFPT